MPGALPLLLAAILTPAGTWHVGAPGSSTQPRPLVATGHRAVAATGQATERSTVVRGQHSRGAMPASAPSEGRVAQPEELRSVAVAAAGPNASAPPGTVRARGPPAG
jgi:hypothetical protein